MSFPLTFPPSANWFSSHVLVSCGSVCAYAAKHEVVFVWIDRETRTPKTRSFTVFDKAKLLAIDLDSDGDGVLNLSTTSEDGLVRAWKVECGNGFKEPAAFKEHELHREQARDVRIATITV